MDSNSVSDAINLLRNVQTQLAMMRRGTGYGSWDVPADNPRNIKLQDAIDTLDLLIGRMSSESAPHKAVDSSHSQSLWPGTSHH